MLGPRRDDPNIPCLVHLDLHGQLGEVLEAMMQNHEYYEFLDGRGQFFFMLPNGFDRQLGCLMVCLHLSIALWKSLVVLEVVQWSIGVFLDGLMGLVVLWISWNFHCKVRKIHVHVRSKR